MGDNNLYRFVDRAYMRGSLLDRALWCIKIDYKENNDESKMAFNNESCKSRFYVILTRSLYAKQRISK
ncbi:hypothetical protein HPU229254_01790 [Helicobacter pullorum]|nr:hypothetical protein HPU229254_01790 [Helicobacter pullorum]